jgi:hypothetical protein
MPRVVAAAQRQRTQPVVVVPESAAPEVEDQPVGMARLTPDLVVVLVATTTQSRTPSLRTLAVTAHLVLSS